MNTELQVVLMSAGYRKIPCIRTCQYTVNSPCFFYCLLDAEYFLQLLFLFSVHSTFPRWGNLHVTAVHKEKKSQE